MLKIFPFTEPHYLQAVSFAKRSRKARPVLRFPRFRGCDAKIMVSHFIVCFFAKMVSGSLCGFVDLHFFKKFPPTPKRGKLFLSLKRRCVKAHELRFALRPVDASEF